jgi:hypothetical protein
LKNLVEALRARLKFDADEKKFATAKDNLSHGRV